MAVLDPEFKETLARLAVSNRRHRLRCCGTSRTMTVLRQEDVAHYKCWRCGLSGSVRLRKPTLKESLAPADIPVQPNPAILERASAVFPTAALAWFWKCGCTDPSEVGARWHEHMQRIVIPVYREGVLTSMILRDPFTKKRKDRYCTLFDTHWPDPFWFWFNDMCNSSSAEKSTGKRDKASTVVLVEDVMSARGVGKVLPSVALLGTRIGIPLLHWLLERGIDRAVLWFDGDDAGEAARKSARRKLALMGIAAHDVRTPNDPKKYSNNATAELLEAYL